MHPRVIDLSLDRVERLLTALGNPERSLPRVVHVAGTNGKGSTLAFLRAIVEAAGYRTHVYTSPHLVRFAERIRVAGQIIDEDALTAVLEDCEAANDGNLITFFEVATAAAYLAFSREEADVTLIETGLGGRFDATNVFEHPALCAITPISMDHMSWLGDTISDIAFEKAGILKPESDAVIAPQTPAAMAVIERRAGELATPLVRSGIDWNISDNGGGLTLVDGDTSLDLPYPALPGAHQYINAAVAALCARRLPGLDISRYAIAQGLLTAQWPGRLQKLTTGDLYDLLPTDWELWLDGGHNQSAAEALVHMLAAWQDRSVHIIFGCLKARDPAPFLKALQPQVRSIHTVTIPGEETALVAEDAAQAALSAGIDARPASSLSAAIEEVIHTNPQPARILICGSLYLAGAVLAENKTPPES